jgi:hypothetical protein
VVDGSITGTSTFQHAGVRLLIASGVTPQSIGGALLDEYGNFVGVIGGTIVPSAPPSKILSLLNNSNSTAALMDLDTTGLAIPASLLPELPMSSAPTALSTLAQQGYLAPLLVRSNLVQYVTISNAVTKQYGSLPLPGSAKQVFSKRDNKFVVFVNWHTSTKQKVSTTLRVFTADNKMISDAKPQTVSISPGNSAATSWDLPLGSISPGIYRLDLLIGDQTSWRDFIRITE